VSQNDMHNIFVYSADMYAKSLVTAYVGVFSFQGGQLDFQWNQNTLAMTSFAIEFHVTALANMSPIVEKVKYNITIHSLKESSVVKCYNQINNSCNLIETMSTVEENVTSIDIVNAKTKALVGAQPGTNFMLTLPYDY
jgi:hypothetical protein